MKWMCDTNIISEVMKRAPHKGVLAWLAQQEQISLSVITVEEVLCGLSHKQAARQTGWFEKLVRDRCDVLPVTDKIARRCGVMRGDFLRKGVVRTQADLFIAATAYEHELTLVTRNEKDFSACGISVFNPFTAPALKQPE